LQKISIVEYAEKAEIYKFSATPNDYSSSTQWSLEKIQAEQAWNLGERTNNVKIAVLDAAFKIDHEDLQANVWINTAEIENNGIDDDNNGFVDDVNGWDIGEDDNDPTPPIGSDIDPSFAHGTFVAGIAAGVTNNGIGMASISHNVQFIPVKLGAGTTTNAMPAGAAPLGIEYAIINNADLITMSFGSFLESDMGTTMHTLIQTAYADSIIILAATGNNFSSDIHYPAKYEEVIAVGATDEYDYRWSYSNYSAEVDIMAPGTNMYSLSTEEPWYMGGVNGTSFSTPLTCATLALMKSSYPTATVYDLKQCLFSGADNIDNQNSAYTGKLGSGRLNAYKSMQCMDEIYNSGVNINSILNNNDIIKIYPNPTFNNLQFTINNLQLIEAVETIEIIDITGRLIEKISNIKIETTNFNIPLSNNMKGIYFLKIETNKNFSIRRFIVE